MNYPLHFRFKILAIAPQIYVTDAVGNAICFVRQKLFKLKENIIVYQDDSKEKTVCEIKADRIIDFSANYSFLSPDGSEFGSIKREGMKSLLRARYKISRGGAEAFELKEENPWTKFFDGLFESIPIIGALSGYVFQPRYGIYDLEGNKYFTVHKRPAFLEGLFDLEQHQETDADMVILMGVLMMILIEKQRG